MSDNKDVKRGIVLYIDGKEVVNNVTSIKAELRKLTKELDGMAIGSKEYVEQTKKIRALKQILNDHQQSLRGISNEVRQSTFSMGKFVDGFNRFGGFIASSVAALTGFILGLRALRDEQNKLEDSQHGLQALTGLDDNSISWLTDKAKELSTTMTKEGLRVRQSANEILDAFMLVGSAKPELLGNKEALSAVTEEAMRLQAAAKDITLNQAVDALTLSLNQYGDASDQAARYANVLAAGSKAGAANIASQAKAIRTAGTAASSANVPIEKTVGLIETLAYKGIKDEIAGTGLKKFFLVLQTGAKELNPAIVGLDKALENLKNKNMGAGAIKKMFGEEGYNVASVILQNTDMVKQFTEAVTDTNIAYEQAAINSDTASAKLEQARNQMKLAGIELIEKLNPAIMFSTNAMTYVIKILPKFIDWFKEWGGTVLWLSGIIFVYSTRMRIISTTMSILNNITKVATILKLAYGVAMNRLHGYTITAYSDLRKLYLLMQGHPALLNILRVGTYLYAAAVQLLRGRIDLAGKAMQNAWKIMASNPIGLLVASVAAAAAISYKLTQRVRDYYNVQKVNEGITEKTAKAYDVQSARIKSLTDKIHNNSLSIRERQKAIEELKSIIPEYNAMISSEGKITEENTKALNKYNKQLSMRIELHEINEELEKRFQNLSSLKKSPSYNDNSLMGSMAREDARQKVEEEEAVINSLRQRRIELYKNLYKLDNPTEDTGESKKKTSVNEDESETEKNKRIKKELEKIDAEYLKKQNDLKKQYLRDDKMTQQDYANELEKLELEKLDKQLTVAGLEPKRREEISHKILDAKVKLYEKIQELGKTNVTNDENVLQSELERIQESHNKKLSLLKYALEKEVLTVKEYNDQKNKLEQETFEKRNKANEKAAQERLRKEERIYGKEVLELRRARITENLTDEQYNKRLRNSRLKWLDRMLSDLKLSEEDRLELQQEYNDLVIEGKEEEYEKMKEAAEKYSSLTKDIATEFSETIGEMIAEGEFSMKGFLKETILMALDALERVIEICCIEVMAKNMAATAPFSFIGAAKAAIQIAAIKAAFAVAKGVVGNFYTGGYTGDGNWDEPKGLVHSNEFVANRFAVANPAVRPVLDLIDNAQRTGSINNLSSDDLAAVTGKGDSSSVTVVSSPSVVPDKGSDDEVKFLMIECARLMKQMEERLKEPLLARTYANGKGGTMEAEELVNKMKYNAKRRK